MPRLKNLPSLEVIKGFKGIIDYGITRGVPYARSWPRTPRSHLTASTQASAALFGEIVASYPLMGAEVVEAYREMAQGTPLTSRDLYVRGVLGYLYELDMSDLATLLEQIRDAIIALDGHITPPLETIDDFALPTNKAYGYYARYAQFVLKTSTGAEWQYANGDIVPPGEIWIMNTISAYHDDPVARPTGISFFETTHDFVLDFNPALTNTQRLLWNGSEVLKAGDRARAFIQNLATGSHLSLEAWGYKMKVA